MVISDESLTIIGIAFSLFEIAGILAAIEAIMHARTSQGAIAWAISLITFPYLALPCFWLFGRSKFEGYIDARRVGNLKIAHIGLHLSGYLPQNNNERIDISHLEILENLAKMPFTCHNRAEILIDGKATFESILKEIESARTYILVQFYIIRSDKIGTELKRKLVRKSEQGVKIYILYDEIGSYKLSAKYIRELRHAGCDMYPFNTTKGRRYKFHLNFRNHRKIVIIDGRIGYVGGVNVGDEYIEGSPELGKWRDTHVRVEGPAVQCVQLSFLEDWYWATNSIPELNWIPQRAIGGNKKVLVVPTGPADDYETCNLLFVHAINSARRRLWIATPYFVPDPQVIVALQLAGLRGVDVRIILPEKVDRFLVYLSSFAYIKDTEGFGVKFYRYRPGFLHQKVMLIDNDIATVGTANLDNRSFRLNFEMILLFADTSFAKEIEKMLIDDMANCRKYTIEDLESRSFLFQLAVSTARLMAPLQ